jgi:hypothetical protein
MCVQQFYRPLKETCNVRALASAWSLQDSHDYTHGLLRTSCNRAPAYAPRTEPGPPLLNLMANTRIHYTLPSHPWVNDDTPAADRQVMHVHACTLRAVSRTNTYAKP